MPARAVAAIDSSKAPAGMTTRIVGIDGPGGAGKTTLSERLAAELDAPIVHTDDFAGWVLAGDATSSDPPGNVRRLPDPRSRGALPRPRSHP
ncbi:MAG: hypothetical protein ACJ77E_17480 [Gaiellaceae bacterium]